MIQYYTGDAFGTLITGYLIVGGHLIGAELYIYDNQVFRYSGTSIKQTSV